MASIIMMSGSQNEFYSLDQSVYVIGRSENLPIQILDEYVSREHLQIHFDKHKNCFCALDLGSTHGVFINDRKIVAETVLADDDRIRIGDTTILFTKEDFSDSESAFSHYKKVGEFEKPTQVE
ncbi:MAG: FHA domain-containing protein [Planctomycetota bacterium]|jgi:pSer/pThr/pTyr-binding forkhead associated (FHA) protein